MLQPEMQAALNKQLNWEQAASQEYLAMAAHFEEQNLKGFASFMRLQSDEERGHAMKIFDYILERGGQVHVGAVPEPTGQFASAKAVFEAAHARERSNTKSIHELFRLAVEKNDYATQSMLNWFITEQVEEEAWCEEAVALLDRAGSDAGALLMLDDRYGKAQGGE